MRDSLLLEIESLRRTLQDMATLSMLPTMWEDYTSEDRIAGSLSEVVLDTLSLDLVYIQFPDRPDGDDGDKAEVTRALHWREDASHPGGAETLAALSPWLEDTFDVTATVPHPRGEGSLSIATTKFGCGGSTGILLAGSQRAGFPTEQEILLLNVAANQAAIAVQRNRVEEERRHSLAREREARQEAQSLNDLARILGAELDLHRLVQQVTDRATELTAAKFGAFFYNAVNEQGESYVLYTLSGAPREAFENFGYPGNTRLFGPTFRGEGVVRIEDVLKDPRYGKSPPHYGMPKGHLPVRAYLAVPVISRLGTVLGGLFFGHPEPGVFTEQAERMVLGLAAHAAIAIDNAMLYQQAQKEIAERRLVEESERAARTVAERATRLRDEFLATVSHELRTPLNSLLGWTQLLRQSPDDEETRLEALGAIERSTRAQIRLIEDLLDVSRIISGKLRLDVQTVELIPIVQAAIETVRPAAEAKEIRIETIIDPLGSGIVKGDPARLQQVLWNLLSNAVKFTSKRGKVQVFVERVNSHIEISVSDNGQGIAPEYLPQVFDRFSQADSSTTRLHGGLGLGLAVVKHLVELHGGQVVAQSPGIGQGATFSVNLPVALVQQDLPGREHPGTARPDAAPAFGETSLRDIRILVVDDDPDACRMLMRVLQECQAEVITATSAGDALETLAETDPHVVISDIGMPEMDGYELMRTLRARGHAMPAVAVTAFARSEDRIRALQAGYNMHVAKPLEPRELITVIASLVRLSP